MVDSGTINGHGVDEASAGCGVDVTTISVSGISDAHPLIHNAAQIEQFRITRPNEMPMLFPHS